MKKFSTLAMATALTAALACTAFADDALLTKEGNTTSAEIYEIDLSSLTEEEVASITQVVADVSCTSNYVNGSIGGNVDGAWSQMASQGEVSSDSGSCSGQFVWDVPGSLVGTDDDGNLSASVQVQFWWVNPIYDDEGNETGEVGVATLTAVTMYDASGNVVYSEGAAAETSDTTPVAYLAAAVALAGVALAASKKARA